MAIRSRYWVGPACCIDQYQKHFGSTGTDSPVSADSSTCRPFDVYEAHVRGDPLALE